MPQHIDIVELKTKRTDPKLSAITDIVSANGGHIAGGYPRWLASPLANPHKPGDIDVFASAPDQVEILRGAFIKAGWYELRQSNFAYTLTPTSDIWEDVPKGGGDMPLNVQIIKAVAPRTTSEALEGILSGFDFTICSVGLNLDLALDADVIAHRNFAYHEAHKLLIWNDLHDPVFAFQRIAKYSEKGYWMPPGETIKLFEAWRAIDEEERERIKGIVRNSHWTKEEFWEDERTFDTLSDDTPPPAPGSDESDLAESDNDDIDF